MGHLKTTWRRFKTLIAGKKTKRAVRFIGVLCSLIFLVGLFRVAHIAYRAIRPRTLEQYTHDVKQILFQPQSGFVGKRRICILLMGVDDNALVNNPDGSIRYGNSDTLMLLCVDLTKPGAYVLSIPRDTYAHIAGTTQWTKINHAYAVGGSACAAATVQELLGLKPDYYLCVSIKDTQRFVDALGGIEVTVEHAMDYDDESGSLHIHLKPGYQHLDGKQTMAFIRFRHEVYKGRMTITPEHGDKRRMYRQQVALRALTGKASSFNTLLSNEGLCDAGMDCLHTDLTRTQILDLVFLLKRIQFSRIQTEQLPATNFRAPDGGADLWVDYETKAVYLHKLLDSPLRVPGE